MQPGLAKRELECTIIKNLIKKKKNFESEQYMLSINWVEQYKEYLYQNINKRPSEINNSLLFDHSNNKIFRNSLILNRDYVLVNDIFWYFIKDEYSGGPDALYEAYLIQQKKQIPAALLRVPSTIHLAEQEIIRSKSTENSIISKVSNLNFPNKIYELPAIGFRNENNFCYMHSGLQCLLSVPEFNYYFLKLLRIIQKEIINKKLIKQLPYSLSFQELIDYIRCESREYIKIGSIKNLICKKFNFKQQHDCQEFLLFLLSSIEEEINAFYRELGRVEPNSLKLCNFNIVEQQFKGKISSYVQCKNCGNTSKKQQEPFITLSLALFKAKSLEQCLQFFFQPEELKDYKCDFCNKKSSAVKRTSMTQLPRNIIFHLKRFIFFPKQYKLSQAISFPLENIALHNYSDQNQKLPYKLRGVIVHQGSLESGHYYSYAKRNHQWYIFNDHVVKKVSRKEVVQQQAYLLFYSLVDM